ncbi:cupin domain-containing protein [Thalassospiraceae bacterium LMO-JJ14]|nr:cupin domain-containing protein [Thalassospiraceae bacterium LMO-JJ14]
MPLNAIDIEAAFAPLTVMKDRTPTSSGPAFEAAFDTLAKTETGGVFAASFQGTSAWERHPNGDELVQIVKGSAQVTVLQEDEENILEMKAGMFVIVPRNCWHRFEAVDGVEVMTMTPQPTDHWRENSLPPKG